MTSSVIERLLSLELHDFRLFRGRQRIDLDAGVVLLYGANGSGKSSLLHGLELAMTGDVADLAAFADDYPRCLRNARSRGTKTQRLRLSDGSRELEQSVELAPGEAVAPSLEIGEAERRFFLERCYLSQMRLSRLLEIYQTPEPESREQPLVRFVRELLRLETVDALIAGLYPAGDVRRLRKVSPALRELENEEEGHERQREVHEAALERWRADWQEQGEAFWAAEAAAALTEVEPGAPDLPESVAGDDAADPETLRRWAEALGRALERAGDDVCPVCHRDYGELGRGPLVDHVRAEIEALGADVEIARRQRARRRGLAARARDLRDRAASVSALEAAGRQAEAPWSRPRPEAPEERQRWLEARGAALDTLEERLGSAAALLDEHGALAEDGEALSREQAELAARRGKLEKALGTARALSRAAQEVQQRSLSRVFEGSLSKLWGELFARLVPGERFRPHLDEPHSVRGRLQAATQAVAVGVAPFEQLGAVLSSGNLNTAALTLFLALHLVEEPKMKVLVLDDPVQNMDDLHVVQMAALLRTLARDAGRQLVIAVHEQALFDYLRLELGPTAEGQALLALTVEKDPDGWGSRVQTERLEWEGDGVGFGEPA